MSGMGTIENVVIEAADVAAAETFYKTAFDMLGDRVRVRESQEPSTGSSGFRGFTLSLIVARPATADDLIEGARAAGATVVKPAAKSMWGYGGAFRAPDGTVWTVASSAKKDSGPATREVDSVVLQLGVADVSASRRFYVDHGLTAGRSFGSRYAELETGPVKLALNKRAAVAKNAGVPAEGTGAHRLVIGGDLGGLTDPDGFGWE
jgi:uncharacterized glyoxalase superfamily protein PhnB